MDGDPTMIDLEGPVIRKKVSPTVVHILSDLQREERMKVETYEDLGDIPMTPTRQVVVVAKEEPILHVQTEIILVEEQEEEPIIDEEPIIALEEQAVEEHSVVEKVPVPTQTEEFLEDEVMHQVEKPSTPPPYHVDEELESTLPIYRSEEEELPTHSPYNGYGDAPMTPPPLHVGYMTPPSMITPTTETFFVTTPIHQEPMDDEDEEEEREATYYADEPEGDEGSTAAHQWEEEVNEITVERANRQLYSNRYEENDDTMDTNDGTSDTNDDTNRTVDTSFAVFEAELPPSFAPSDNEDDDDSLLRDDEDNTIVDRGVEGETQLVSQMIGDGGIGITSFLAAAGMAIEDVVCGPANVDEYDTMEEDEETAVTEEDDSQRQHVFVLPKGGISRSSRVIKNENRDSISDVILDGVVSIGMGVMAVGAAVASSFDPPEEAASHKERTNSARDIDSAEELEPEYDLNSDQERETFDENKDVYAKRLREVSSEEDDDEYLESDNRSEEQGEISSFTSDVVSPIGTSSRYVDLVGSPRNRNVIENGLPRPSFGRDSSGHVDYLIARAQLNEELNSLFREVEEFENSVEECDDDIYINDYGPPKGSPPASEPFLPTSPVSRQLDPINSFMAGVTLRNFDDIENSIDSIPLTAEKEPSKLSMPELSSATVSPGTDAASDDDFHSTKYGDEEDADIAIKLATPPNREYLNSIAQVEDDTKVVPPVPRTLFDEDPSMSEEENGTVSSHRVSKGLDYDEGIDVENPPVYRFGSVNPSNSEKANGFSAYRDTGNATESKSDSSRETCKVIGYEQPQDCGNTVASTKYEKSTKFVDRCTCSRKRCILIGSIVLLSFLVLLLIIGFGSGAFGGKKNSSSSLQGGGITVPPTGSPTGSPTPSPTQDRRDVFASLISSITFDGGKSLEDDNSPEALAYNWIVNNDALSLDPNDMSEKNQMRIAQRYGLATLYFNSVTATWENETEWLGVNECIWFGVVCGENGEVVKVRMLENLMVGTLSLDIATLTNLTELNLSGNKLDGTLPSTLATMTNLRVLAVQDNAFSGELSVVDYSKMVELKVFDAEKNSFTGSLPASLYQATSLNILSLDKNNVTGSIASDIGNLVYLERLTLIGNDFKGSLPSEISRLDKLETLWLSQNRFNGTLPTQVGKMTSLVSIDLFSNEFAGPIPTEIGNLVNLQRLVFSNNGFSNTIPSILGSLTALTVLKLNDNLFSGSFPGQIGNIRVLQALTFEFNNIWGQLPDFLTNLQNLEVLYCGDNALSGTIPRNIGNMLALREFKCSRNRVRNTRTSGITGTIPRSFGFLTNLEILQVFQNGLTGTIPADMGKMSSLELLDLELNFLNETVPSELGNLGNLTILHIGGNMFNDTLPTEICDLNLDSYTADCNMTFCTCCTGCGSKRETGTR